MPSDSYLFRECRFSEMSRSTVVAILAVCVIFVQARNLDNSREDESSVPDLDPSGTLMHSLISLPLANAAC